jgi:hypothetical protein
MELFAGIGGFFIMCALVFALDILTKAHGR